jgi:type II secretory pathway component PulJ
MPRSWRGGFTLVEIVLAMFVFGFILVAVGDTVVAAYQNHENRTGDINMMRQGAIAMDTLERELRMCESVYYPDPDPSHHGGGIPYNQASAWSPSWTANGPGFPAWQPLKSTNTPFIFTYYQQTAKSEIVVGYWLNDSDNCVERLVYPTTGQSDFYPSPPPPASPPQVLASNVQSFSFYELNQNTVAAAINGPNNFANDQPFISASMVLSRPVHPQAGQRFFSLPLECHVPVISL